MRSKLLAVPCVVALTFASAAPAYAWDCIVAKKPAQAGAVGQVTIDGEGNETFTPLKKNPGTEDKPHGAFVAVSDGTSSTSIYVRKLLPPVSQGGPQHNCDGKGLDSAEVCFGGH